MAIIMKRFFSHLSDKFFPPKCVFCDSFMKNSDFRVCGKCLEEIEYNNNRCRICGTGLESVYGDRLCLKCRTTKRPFVRTFVPLVYKDKVRISLLKFKFGGRKSFGRTFAALIFLDIKNYGYIPDMITYVPIHFFRKSKRGYNQSALIAESLSDMLNVPCRPLVKKTGNTKPLSKVKFREREKIVKGAFAPSIKEPLLKENILLVDDIITTGATVSECARIIKKMGSGEISVAAVAAVR